MFLISVNGIAIHLLIHGRILPFSQLPIRPINISSNISPLPVHTIPQSPSLITRNYLPHALTQKPFEGLEPVHFTMSLLIGKAVEGGPTARGFLRNEKWAVLGGGNTCEVGLQVRRCGALSWNQKFRRVAAGAVREKLLLPTSLTVLSGWQLYNQTGQELEL